VLHSHFAISTSNSSVTHYKFSRLRLMIPRLWSLPSSC
jgi:hypothetical protein